MQDKANQSDKDSERGFPCVCIFIVFSAYI